MDFDPRRDYPLREHRPDLVRTASGLALDEVTLEGLAAGRFDAAELRATPETIRRQAAVARAGGREPLARNLERAAELAGVDADTVLAVYTALRPGRSSAEELEGWAARLEGELGAPLNAAFVREATAHYVRRGLLR